MKIKIILSIVLIISFARIAGGRIRSENFCITTTVISGSGETISSENFTITSTLGQSSPLMATEDPLLSENFIISPGFWYTRGADVCSDICQLHLNAGWSMVSLCVTPSTLRRGDLFPSALAFFGFENKTYVDISENDTLEVGKGYWIFLREPQTYTLTGSPIASYTVNTNGGWSIIGSCSSLAVPSVSEGEIVSIFAYEDGIYRRVDVLEPGQGYWIYCTSKAQITASQL